VTPYKLEDKFYPLVFAADALLPTLNKANMSAGYVSTIQLNSFENCIKISMGTYVVHTNG